jgi:TonB family protein
MTQPSPAPGLAPRLPVALAAIPAVTPAAAAAPAGTIDPVAQLAHAVIDRVASDHARELSGCDGGEELHGEVTVKFSVNTSGKVMQAQIATGIKRPQVAGCILRLIQKWQFPPQGGAGAQGTYTLVFQ